MSYESMNFQHYTTWILGKVDNSNTKVAKLSSLFVNHCLDMN